jgi:hypothetical protein
MNLLIFVFIKKNVAIAKPPPVKRATRNTNNVDYDEENEDDVSDESSNQENEDYDEDEELLAHVKNKEFNNYFRK